jgi:hypothetical protein
MTKLDNHVFTKNGREISVFYLTKKDCKKHNVPAYDCIRLCLTPPDDPKEEAGIYMRPDEAIIIAKLLINSIYRSVRCYSMGVLRKK